MSDWIALARSAPGVMIELITHRTSAYCLFAGHTPDWRTDCLACRYCPKEYAEVTSKILRENKAAPQRANARGHDDKG